MDKYGKDTVQACIEELLTMANKHMNGLIAAGARWDILRHGRS